MKAMLFFWSFLLLFPFEHLGAGSLFPGDNFSPGWQRDGQIRSFKEADLFNHINGGAELFLEFGFKELQVQSYKKGESQLTVELYEMESPTSALGIYLFKCGKEIPDKEINARNSSDPYQYVVVKNSYFLLVNNFSGNKAQLPVMTRLTKKILAGIPAQPDIPLIDRFPRGGLVPGSILILRGLYGLQRVFTFGDGDIFQLDGKIFALAGDFTNRTGETFTLISIPYPDRATAMKAFANLLENLDTYLEVLLQEEGRLVFKDYRGQYGEVGIYDNRIKAWIKLEASPLSAGDSKQK